MANVKVSSYNIHSCVGSDGIYSLERVARVIREGDALIVCLQEVEVNPTTTAIKTRIWSSHHNDDHPADISSLAGFQYHAFAPAIRSRALSSRWKERHELVSDVDVVSGNFSDEHHTWKNEKYAHDGCEEQGINYTGKFGIAILSKCPIVEVRTHQYQRYKHKTLRNAMACLISLPNNNLCWIVNTHLGCHFIGKEQNKQAEELVVFIDSLERRNPKICGVILCGDLNSPPLFSSIRTIQQSGMYDVWQQSSFAAAAAAGNAQRRRRRMVIGGTFPSDARVLGMPISCFRKLLRLDYIFVHKSTTGRREIVCKGVHVQDDGLECSLASDHLPLCAVFFIGSL
ncbi:hypothetical protein ACHAXR_008019 [Thalassiosira sp. AJA248-18]